jgi:Transposase
LGRVPLRAATKRFVDPTAGRLHADLERVAFGATTGVLAGDELGEKAFILAPQLSRTAVKLCCHRMDSYFADTLEAHQEGVLNYYDFKISTGPLEGTNNKIKTMKRQAYGFRDQEFFKLKILGIHETK